MITFNCPKCGRSFHVPDDYAGRKARCKNCATELTVPTAATAPPPAPAAPRQPVLPPPRVRRLVADLRQMQSAFARSKVIRFEPKRGNPPEEYEVYYTIKGLEPGPDGQPIVRTEHTAQISLPADYPRMPPQCRMLTPIFHPNIDPAAICIGDHWSAGQRLADLVIRIGEMIAYQSYYTRSPLNGEAAMWADLNAQSLPLDAREFSAAIC